MTQCWLRTNVRAASLGFLVPGVMALTGALLIALLPGRDGMSLWQWAGAALLALALALAAAVAYMLRLPRLACDGRHLLVYLRGVAPQRVPIDVVECFFLGEAPSMMPGKQGSGAKTSAVVVRLAERATEWHNRDVNPALGKWQDGYITVRGTWCEPLTAEVLQRLNDRLVAAHRDIRQQAKDDAA